MTLLESFVGFMFQGSRSNARPLTGAEKRTEEGALLRTEIDVLLESASDSRSDGDLWGAAEVLETASQKLDAAGSVRRAIELRRDAAQTYTEFAESATRYRDVVDGYTHAARAFLVAGDIDCAKASSDRAQISKTDTPGASPAESRERRERT